MLSGNWQFWMLCYFVKWIYIKHQCIFDSSALCLFLNFWCNIHHQFLSDTIKKMPLEGTEITPVIRQYSSSGSMSNIHWSNSDEKWPSDQLFKLMGCVQMWGVCHWPLMKILMWKMQFFPLVSQLWNSKTTNGALLTNKIDDPLGLWFIN